jgi:hypothetical protein
MSTEMTIDVYTEYDALNRFLRVKGYDQCQNSENNLWIVRSLRNIDWSQPLHHVVIVSQLGMRDLAHGTGVHYTINVNYHDPVLFQHAINCLYEYVQLRDAGLLDSLPDIPPLCDGRGCRQQHLHTAFNHRMPIPRATIPALAHM